jgi:hypothetical protein
LRDFVVEVAAFVTSGKKIGLNYKGNRVAWYFGKSWLRVFDQMLENKDRTKECGCFIQPVNAMSILGVENEPSTEVEVHVDHSTPSR